MLERVKKTVENIDDKAPGARTPRIDRLWLTIAPKFTKAKDVYDKYNSLSEVARGKLKNYEDTYGKLGDINNLYFTLKGFKLSPLERKQKGMIDVFKKTKNPRKMSPKERQKHLDDLDMLMKRLNNITGNHEAGSYRDELVKSLKVYSEAVNKVHNGEGASDEDLGKAGEILSKSKDILGKVAEPYNKMYKVVKDLNKYEHMKYFAKNVVPLATMTLALHRGAMGPLKGGKSLVKKITTTSQKIDKLLEEEGRRPLTKREAKRNSKLTAKLEDYKKKAGDLGIFISSELDAPNNDNQYDIVHVRFRDLTPEMQEKIKKIYSKPRAVGAVITAILGGTTAYMKHMDAINARNADITELTTENAALSQANSALAQQQTGVAPSHENMAPPVSQPGTPSPSHEVLTRPEAHNILPNAIANLTPEQQAILLFAGVVATGVGRVALNVRKNSKNAEVLEWMKDPSNVLNTTAMKKAAKSGELGLPSSELAERHSKPLVNLLKDAKENAHMMVGPDGLTFFFPRDKPQA